MKMEADARKKYPDFRWWLELTLPALPEEKPKVWRAFRRQTPSPLFFYQSMFSSRPFFLTWGFAPLIRPYVFSKGCEPDGTPEKKDGYLVQKYSLKHMGMTSPDGQFILIAEDLVRGAGHPEVNKVLEATVLHELVHWCRWWAGEDVYDEGPPYAFEKEAYGDVVIRTWATCMDDVYYEVP